MAFKEEFLDDPQAFMRKYTLYFPGVRGDGGSVDFQDPSYQVYYGNQNIINVAATPVEAAWRQGVRTNHVTLALKVAPNYKMRATGRTMIPAGAGRDAAAVPMLGSYEEEKKALIRKAKQGGATDRTAEKYAKEALVRTGRKVDSDEWFECYFLPYSQGRTTQMTLSDDAHFFFTATMNGCAFRVSGNPRTPTVAHLNTTKPEDTLPDAVVTKDKIKRRYGKAIGHGGTHDAVLTKYKGPAGFGGHKQKYKLDPAELNAINDPGLAPGAKAAADLNTFLVGIYDDTNNCWEFFYQRNAVLLTNVHKVTLMAGDYHAKNPFQWVKKKLHKDHKFKFGVDRTVTDSATPINHVVTPCQRLIFP